MSDEPKGMLQTAADAVSFDRILVMGVMGLIFSSLILSAIVMFLVFFFKVDPKESVQVVLNTQAYYKDISIFMAGFLSKMATDHLMKGKPDA